MGLDMYLRGRKYVIHNYDDPMDNPTMDGYSVVSYEIELGYWRKHPNLHGYIVQTFGGGQDNCQEIELNEEAIVQILDAIKEKRLPATTGFFFGESDGSEIEADTEIFTKALKWLNEKSRYQIRSVYYQASW